MNLTEKIKNSDLVVSTKEYNPSAAVSRLYITLKGFDRSYRGDQGTQVYIDNKSGLLIVKRAAKGLVSRGLEESLTTLREQFPDLVEQR